MMKAECCLESGRIVKKYMKNETKCTICKGSVFRVDRVTPELIMLVCENCGEPHMVGITSDEKGVHLVFWGTESGIEE
jgi:hypothetical protein